MNILIAPLNWGLGHAARCIPLVNRFLHEGHTVTLGGDGNAWLLLREHFPNLPVAPLPELQLHYSRTNRQVLAMLTALPRMILWAIRDHRALDILLNTDHFDLVVSDNRFGLYSSRTKCVYITHQLHIMLPRPWCWLEPLAERWHAAIIRRYSECWVPDFPDSNGLSGALGHLENSTARRLVDSPAPLLRYIGPLSRFAVFNSPPKIGEVADRPKGYDIVAVLSGLEPQRTLFEQQIIREYASRSERVLIVQGLVDPPARRLVDSLTCRLVDSSTPQNITLVPSLPDAELVAALQSADLIIARSGYSTIMDLHALGLLHKARLVPTPGQPEQEYLARKIAPYLSKNA